ncbi:hypothetical protein ABZY19_30305 [Streptomyces sp. NPDC006475]|uniref:hypothetical protein n=1 Tax=Streptomyces sp. NPDC006475 TaxID=3155719 RepID=UPI0033B7D788
MTTNSPIRTRTLLLAAALLAASGCLLIVFALPGAPPPDRAVPLPSAAAESPPDSEATGTGTPSRPASVGATPAGALPPPGSGPAADPSVQRALERAMPRDLPAGLSSRLATLSRAVWAAEVTGIGRQKWPRHFTQPATAAYTRVRIQAAVARRDPHQPGTKAAVVHLVWAGADPSGTYLDGRPATVRFTREGATWNPVR